MESMESVGEEKVERTSEVATRIENLKLRPKNGAWAGKSGQRGLV